MRFRKIFCALLLGAVQMAASADTVTVFGDDTYPPVMFIKDGQPSGLLVTILKKAESLTGDRYEVQLAPWKRSYEMAINAGGGIIGLSHNNERAKIFDFSKAFYYDDIQIVTLKDKSFAYSKLEDLKGKVIGGVNGASYGDAVDKAIASGVFTVERDVSQSGRLRKLLAGRLDAAFIGNGKAGFDITVAANKELFDNRDKFVALPVPLTKDPLHLGFAKSMKKLDVIKRFDDAIDKLRRSGELQKLVAESSK